MLSPRPYGPSSAVPIEIAYAVRWLASDEAAAVHGISLDVDGGMAATRLS